MKLGPDLVTEPRGTTELTSFGMPKSYKDRRIAASRLSSAA